jgi:hypothetical protein
MATNSELLEITNTMIKKLHDDINILQEQAFGGGRLREMWRGTAETTRGNWCADRHGRPDRPVTVDLARPSILVLTVDLEIGKVTTSPFMTVVE